MAGINNDFNISAEKNLQNRMEAYQLTDKERQTIWQNVQNRDKDIEGEKKQFNNQDVWNQRFKEAYDDIKSRQKPNPQYNYTQNPQVSDFQIRQQAANQVQQNHFAKIKGLRQNCDNQNEAIFKNAFQQGRGLQNSNNQTLTQNFNQSQDWPNPSNSKNTGNQQSNFQKGDLSQNFNQNHDFDRR